MIHVITRQEIITKVKTLNLPQNSYVVFGSCPMAAADIREANDIDLLVTEQVFAQLKAIGWPGVEISSRQQLLSLNKAIFCLLR